MNLVRVPGDGWNSLLSSIIQYLSGNLPTASSIHLQPYKITTAIINNAKFPNVDGLVEKWTSKS